MNKKLAYIFMTFDTLTEYHLDKSLESFNNQNKSLIDTLIVYNNSTTFHNDLIKSKIDFDNVIIFNKPLPTDKRMVSDINTQLQYIDGFDIYLLHKADFYIPSHLVEFTYHSLNLDEPSFLNYSKFDMREDIKEKIINELNLSDFKTFSDVCKLPQVIKDTKGLSLQHRLIGYRGHDGSMHAYNELARKVLHFDNFIYPADWQNNIKRGIKMLKGIPEAFCYHLWHDIGKRSDGGGLGKNIIGHRF